MVLSVPVGPAYAMKAVLLMTSTRTLIAMAALALSSPAAWALSNSLQADFQTVNLPLQKTIGNVFASQGQGLYLDQTGHSVSDANGSTLTWTPTASLLNFVDDYVFTLPNQAQATAQVTSIAWSNLVGIESLTMRLYDATAGLSLTDLGSASVFATRTVQSLDPITIATSYFDKPLVLQAGHRYALEVMGRVVGISGGNYSGSLVVTSTPAVPEPANAWLGLAGLAVFASLMRRGKPSSAQA